MKFDGYRTIKFRYQGRVLWIVIDGRGPMNAVDADMHEDEMLSNLTADRQEAVRAFVEKRPPAYRGD